MDINSILKGVECTCGKMHKCSIEAVYIENNAISRLINLCADYENIVLVADQNTWDAAGTKVEKVLSAKKTKHVIFDGSSVLIPDERAIDTVNTALDNTELIVGIGSGVIQDLCKYVSFFAKIPYMIVATAPSMDGYASDGAAMILKGMKETVPAGLPKAIIADTSVLKEAPMDMIKAGYGDIVGKYSALCDWKLSHCINGEYLCDYIYDTTFCMIRNTLDTAKGLLDRDEESIRTLTEALMIVGIMMSFAGSSRPASGSEHHLSHFFEITGIVNNCEYFPHGIDVAYSTIITAAIRDRIVKSAFPSAIFRENKEQYLEKMNSVYASVANECVALQDRVGNYRADRLATYLEKEQEIKSILAQMPSPEEIEQMLSFMGLYIKDFYEMYGKEKISDAVKYAKDLKDRYTVLWINYDLFAGEI